MSNVAEPCTVGGVDSPGSEVGGIRTSAIVFVVHEILGDDIFCRLVRSEAC